MSRRRKKPKTGRPSKLTPAVQAKIIQAIQGGNYREVAAQWAGITDRTFLNWMTAGEAASSGPFRAFFLAVNSAEKSAEIRAVALIMKHAVTDPKHAEWWLERKFHDRWGRRTMEVSGPGGGPMTFKLSGLNDEELQQMAGLLAKIQR